MSWKLDPSGLLNRILPHVETRGNTCSLTKKSTPERRGIGTVEAEGSKKGDRDGTIRVGRERKDLSQTRKNKTYYYYKEIECVRKKSLSLPEKDPGEGDKLPWRGDAAILGKSRPVSPICLGGGGRKAAASVPGARIQRRIKVGGKTRRFDLARRAYVREEGGLNTAARR